MTKDFTFREILSSSLFHKIALSPLPFIHTEKTTEPKKTPSDNSVKEESNNSSNLTIQEDLELGLPSTIENPPQPIEPTFTLPVSKKQPQTPTTIPSPIPQSTKLSEVSITIPAQTPSPIPDSKLTPTKIKPKIKRFGLVTLGLLAASYLNWNLFQLSTPAPIPDPVVPDPFPGPVVPTNFPSPNPTITPTPTIFPFPNPTPNTFTNTSSFPPSSITNLFAEDSFVSAIDPVFDNVLLTAQQNSSLTIDDSLLAHLIGLNSGHLSEISIDGQELEGSFATKTLPLIIDLLQSYKESLSSYPPLCSAIVREEDQDVIEQLDISAEDLSDSFLVDRAIRHMEEGLELAELLGGEQQEFSSVLTEKIQGLQDQESLFIPGGWSGSPPHAIHYEIQREPHSFTLRVYNLGAGSGFHISGLIDEERVQANLPYAEITNIPIQNLGHAFGNILYQFKSPLESVEWDDRDIYQQLLGSIKGEVSTRPALSYQLRKTQAIGNCAMNSPFLALDRILVSERLAEKMRLHALYASTVAYYDKYKEEFPTQSETMEARRRLLMHSCAATLLQIERVAQVRGSSHQSLQIITNETKKINDIISSIQKQSYGDVGTQSVDFSLSSQWNVGNILPNDQTWLPPKQTNQKAQQQSFPLASQKIKINNAKKTTIQNSVAKINDESIPLNEKRRIGQEICNALSLTDQFENEQKVQARLEELAPLQQALATTFASSPVIASEDMLALLRLSTYRVALIDQLENPYSIPISPLSSAVIKGFLGISSTPEKYPALRPHAYSRKSFAELQEFWSKREEPTTDPFDLSVRPLGQSEEQGSHVRHIVIGSIPLAKIAGKLGYVPDDTKNDYPYLLELSQWIAQNRKTIDPLSSTFPNKKPQDIALQILGGSHDKIFSKLSYSLKEAMFWQALLDTKVSKETPLSSLSFTAKREIVDGKNELWTLTPELTAYGVLSWNREQPKQRPKDFPFLVQEQILPLPDSTIEECLRNYDLTETRQSRRRFSSEKVPQLLHHQIDGMHLVPRDAILELAQFSSIASLQPRRIIDHYSGSPNELADRNILSLIDELFTETGVIERAKQQDPNLVKDAQDFFAQQRRLAKNSNQYEVFGFFASLEIQFLTLAGETCDAEKIDALFSSAIETASEANQEKALSVYHFYRAYSLIEHKKIDEKLLGKLLGSIAYITNYPLPKTLDDVPIYNTDQLKDLVKIRFNKDVKTILEKEESRNTALSLMLSDYLGTSYQEQSWLPFNYFPQFTTKDQQTSYNLYTGQLLTTKLQKTRLPENLLKSPLLEQIQSIEQEEIPHSLHGGPGGGYKHIFSNGNEYIFSLTASMEGSSRKKIGDSWYKATSLKKLEDLPITEPIEENIGIAWVQESSTPNQLIIEGVPHVHPIKLTKNKNHRWSAQFLSEKQEFTIASQALPQFIQRLEDPEYTIATMDKKGIQTLLFPRMELSFTRDENNHLTSKQLGSFSVQEGNQQFIPLFGDFSDYLILHKKDQEGIVIRKSSVAPIPQKILSTPSKLQPAAKGWKQQVGYHLYKVNGAFLVPETDTQEEKILAYHQLVQIFLSEKKYDQAFYYLLEADRTAKAYTDTLSQEVGESLQQIALANFNLDFNAVSIRAAAQASLIRLEKLERIENSILSTLNDQDKKRLEQDKKRYKNNLVNIADSNALTEDMERVLYGQPLRQKRHEPLKSLPRAGSESTLQQQKIDFSGANLPFPPAPADAINKEVEQYNLSSFTPSFIESIIKGTLPLRAMLKKPDDIRKTDLTQLQTAFSLPHDLTREETKEQITILIEARYRTLCLALKKLEEKKVKLSDQKQQREVEQEIVVLAMLVNAYRDDAKQTLAFEKDAEKIQKALGAIDLANAKQSILDSAQSTIGVFFNEKKSQLDVFWSSISSDAGLPLPLNIELEQLQSLQKNIGPHAIEDIALIPIQEQDFRFFDSPQMERASHPGNVLWHNYAHGLAETKEKSPKWFPSYVVEPLSKFSKKVFSKLQQSEEGYFSKKEEMVSVYTIEDRDALEQTKKQLTKDAKDLFENIKNKQKKIESLLNRQSTDPERAVYLQSQVLRGHRRELTFEDAQAALARGWDRQFLQDLNPELSLDEIDKIFMETESILYDLREAQHIKRIAKAMQKALVSDPKSSIHKFILQELADLLKRQTLCDYCSNYRLLVLETTLDIALWDEQIPAINALAPADFASYVIELAMAMGKTDVISPAVLAMLADGYSVPIFVMPKELMKGTIPRTQQQLGKTFRTEIRSLPILRKKRSAETILAYSKEIDAAAKLRIPIAWSASDIQTLVNSCTIDFEALLEEEQGASIEKIRAWQVLFTNLKNRGVILGDEIHALLNILTSYNFSVGKDEPLSDTELDAATHFISVFSTTESIFQNTKVFFLPSSQGTPFTEKHYKTVVKKQIVDQLLKEHITGHPKIKEHLQKLPLKKKEKIEAYLMSSLTIGKKVIWKKQKDVKKDIEKIGLPNLAKYSTTGEKISHLLQSDRKYIKNLEEYSPENVAQELKALEESYAAINKEFLGHLGFYKEALRSVFYHTASKKFGKHYALDQKGETAIPAEEGIPQYNSIFGSSMERSLYTIYSFLSRGISNKIIENDLEKFVKQLKTEQATSTNFNPEESEVIKAFNDRYPAFELSSFDFTKKQIKKIISFVKTSPKTQLQIIREYILPKITEYPKEIISSTHLFGFIANRLSGMSGTLFNLDTYKTLFDHQKGSDTIHLVVDRIKQVAPKTVTSVEMLSDPIQNRLNLFTASITGATSIIDTASTIPEEMARELAQKTLSYLTEKQEGKPTPKGFDPSIRGIVYYEGDDLMVLLKGESSPKLYDKEMNRKGLIAWWDLAHTVGSDIRLPLSAKGILFVGRHIKLYQIAQAAMRERGLGKGQGIELMTSKEDRSIMAAKLQEHLDITIEEDQELTIDQVIQYAALNEAEEEAHNNFRTIDHRIRMTLLGKISELLWKERESGDPLYLPDDQLLKLYELSRFLFIKTHHKDPWIKFGEPIFAIDIEEAKERKLQEWKSHPVIENIKKNPYLFPNIQIDQLIQKWKEIIQEDLGILHETIELAASLGEKSRTHAFAFVEEETEKDIETVSVEEMEVDESRKVAKRDRTDQTLLGEPYEKRTVIQAPSQPFLAKSYTPVPLKKMLQMTNKDLPAGSVLTSNDWVRLDPQLQEGLDWNEPNIHLSSNFATVWTDASNTNPVGTPHDLFQPPGRYALAIQNKKTQHVELIILTPKDLDLFLTKLQKDTTPKDQKQVHLALYSLESEKFIGAKGTTDEWAKTHQQVTKLLARAKILSGIPNFKEEDTKKELESFLNERNSFLVLQTFINRICRNLPHVRSITASSTLGKQVVSSGVTKDRVEQLTTSDTLKARDLFTSLIHDLHLDEGQTALTIQEIKKLAGQDFSSIAQDFSNHFMPLLAMQPLTQEDEDTPAVPPAKMTQVLPLVFPTIADEYGAWQSVVPSFSIEKNHLTSDEWEKIKEQGSKSDTDQIRMQLEKNTNSSKTGSGRILQLLTLQTMVHPYHGIPSLQKPQENTNIINSWLQQAPSSLFLTDQTVGKKVGHLALESADFSTALLRIMEEQKEYPTFEFITLINYLRENKLNIEGQHSFALHLLRFFPHLLSDDLDYTLIAVRYAVQLHIESVLSNSNHAIAKSELFTVLNELQSLWDQNYKLFYKTDFHTILQGLTNLANPETAQSVAQWANKKLCTVDSPSIFLDLIITQLQYRKKSLIEHDALQEYYTKGKHVFLAGTKSFFNNHPENAPIKLLFDYDSKDIEIFPTAMDNTIILRGATLWDIHSLDLQEAIFTLQTIRKTPLTAESLIHQLASVSDKHDVNKSASSDHPLMQRFSEVIQNFSDKEELTTQAQKDLCKLLKNLEEVLHFSSLSIDEFTNFNKENLFAIRHLAHHYQATDEEKTQQAVTQILHLFSKDSSTAEKFSLTEFIPNELFKNTSKISTDQIKNVLSEAKNFADQNHEYWENPSEEISRVTKEQLFETLLPITLNGTEEQKKATISWLNTHLETATQPNWLLHDFLEHLSANEENALSEIEYSGIKSYINKYKQHKTSFVNDLFSDLIHTPKWIDLYSPTIDFDFFAQLIQLPVKDIPSVVNPSAFIDLASFTEKAVTYFNKDNPNILSLTPIVQRLEQEYGVRTNQQEPSLKNLLTAIGKTITDKLPDSIRDPYITLAQMASYSTDRPLDHYLSLINDLPTMENFFQKQNIDLAIAKILVPLIKDDQWVHTILNAHANVLTTQHLNIIVDQEGAVEQIQNWLSQQGNLCPQTFKLLAYIDPTTLPYTIVQDCWESIEDHERNILAEKWKIADEHIFASWKVTHFLSKIQLQDPQPYTTTELLQEAFSIDDLIKITPVLESVLKSTTSRYSDAVNWLENNLLVKIANKKNHSDYMYKTIFPLIGTEKIKDWFSNQLSIEILPLSIKMYKGIDCEKFTEFFNNLSIEERKNAYSLMRLPKYQGFRDTEAKHFPPLYDPEILYFIYPYYWKNAPQTTVKDFLNRYLVASEQAINNGADNQVPTLSYLEKILEDNSVLRDPFADNHAFSWVQSQISSSTPHPLAEEILTYLFKLNTKVVFSHINYNTLQHYVTSVANQDTLNTIHPHLAAILRHTEDLSVTISLLNLTVEGHEPKSPEEISDVLVRTIQTDANPHYLKMLVEFGDKSDKEKLRTAFAFLEKKIDRFSVLEYKKEVSSLIKKIYQTDKGSINIVQLLNDDKTLYINDFTEFFILLIKETPSKDWIPAFLDKGIQSDLENKIFAEIRYDHQTITWVEDHFAENIHLLKRVYSNPKEFSFPKIKKSWGKISNKNKKEVAKVFTQLPNPPVYQDFALQSLAFSIPLKDRPTLEREDLFKRIAIEVKQLDNHYECEPLLQLASEDLGFFSRLNQKEKEYISAILAKAATVKRQSTTLKKQIKKLKGYI